MIRIGSMCSGYGGLDLGVEAALGPARLEWVADPDAGAAKILAHHWPDIPNHGDIRSTDWANIPAVDVLTAGFPCQPASLAGRRAGLLDDRWLFDDICDAIGRMVTRPRMLVFENVPGLLTVGGGDAMARVVHGLARLGYVGSWRTLAASDVGAPHRRRRIIIVAQDAHREPWGEWRLTAPGQASGRRAWSDTRRRDRAPATDAHSVDAPHLSRVPRPGQGRITGAGASAHTPGDGRHQGRARSEGQQGRPDVAERGHAPADSACLGHGDPRSSSLAGVPAAPVSGGPAAVRREPYAPAHPDGTSGEALGGRPRPRDERRSQPLVSRRQDWGAYAPAITRWEHVTGRPAPAPTDPTGRGGAHRLAPAFVEWLMGLPDGWVTDVPGLSRAAQLKALGNGVVWQQAAAALLDLLGE